MQRLGSNERCPKGLHPLPQSMKENCTEFDAEKFKHEPSILVALQNGRLGNQVILIQRSERRR